jgi:hypothetical protein
MTQEIEKVTVHTVIGIPFGHWLVCAGHDPKGPRGGRAGRCVSGRFIGGGFNSRKSADAFADEYARRTGAEII